ncbi:putative quinol monooxygenase [Arthrobacter sp. NPDC057013]|uniref:putative quinol monooxygenase n=1 Tax=Arthrobacter sp. NPDC057013 TaxID=3345999 RepID=UPI00362A84F4
MFNVVAHYGTKPGVIDQVLELLGAMAEATRKEPGNISYDFYRGVQDTTQIVILQSYHDADDFNRHRESQHFLELGATKIIPRLASRHVSTYTTEVIPNEVP